MSDPLGPYLGGGQRRSDTGPPSSLDTYIERGRDEEKNRLTLSVQTPPAGERAARVMRLQERTRLPAEVIERNLDDIERQARRTELDPDDFRKQSPGVAAWLAQNPRHHELAGDDLPNLSKLEQLYIALSGPKGSRDRQHGMRVVRGLRRGRGETEVGRIASEARDAGGLDALPDARRHRLEALEKEIGAQDGGWDFVEGTAKIIGQMSSMVPSALAYGIGGASTGAALAAAGGPTILAAPFAAGVGFTAGVAAGFARESYILEGGHSYLAMRRQGVEHETAANISHGVGFVNALLETGGLATIARPFKLAAQRFVRQSATDALVKPTMRQAMNDFGASYFTALAGETGTEIAQEVTSIVGEELAKMGEEGLLDDPAQHESVWNRLAGITKETVEGMALLALPGASVRGASTAHAARKAAQREQYFTALGETVAESKTFARLPKALQDVVASAQQRNGGAVENVYIDAPELVTYFQSKKIDAAAVAEDLGIADQLADAVESGGMLAIPISRYATVIAPTEHNAFFAKELRTKPTEMNAREAAEFMEALQQASEAQPVAGQEDAGAGIQGSADAIGMMITEQLRAAGYNDNIASTQAKLYSAAFRTLGQRTGRDPMELFQRYGLSVTAPRQVPAAAGATVDIKEVVSRAVAHREAIAEQAAERAAMEPTPYDIPRDKRDADARNEAGELLYPRTGKGALRGNLEKVSTDGLIDEVAVLSEAQQADRDLEERYNAWVGSGLAHDIAELPEAERTGKSRRTTDEHGNRVKRKAEDLPDADGMMDAERLAEMRALEKEYRKASRSIEARKKAVAKIEAELARRGVEDYHERLFKKIAGDEGADFDPSTFNQSAIDRFMALRGAELDERLAPNVRAEAARRAAAIESQARSELEARRQNAIREYAERHGEEAAMVFNQSPIDEYGGSHRPPGPEDGAPLHDLTGGGNIYPDDVYGANAVRYYGTGYGSMDQQSFAIAQRAKGNPNALVTIYRAIPDDLTVADRIAKFEKHKAYIQKHGKVPPNVETNLSRSAYYDSIALELDRLREVTEPDASVRINRGDWVTINRAYAKQHGESVLNGNYKIISRRVRAGDIYTNGDSIHEWGFWPQSDAVTETLEQALPGGERPRGQISFGVDGSEVNIALLEDADLSTFLHETGHFYLEVLRDLASQPDAPIEIVSDFDTVKTWVGWQDGQSAFTREQHEKWAEGFEKYLMEGKAPNAELRTAFSKFRAWLVSVYKSLGNLRVFLTDDVRGVMDRLLATDEEITAAEQEIAAGGVAEAMRKAGINEATIAKVAQAEAAARVAGEEALSAKMIASYKRELDAINTAEYQRIRAEVAEEVNQERDYQVLAFLQRGTKPDGTPLPAELVPEKLSKDGLLEYEGTIPNLMARLRSRFLYVKEGGLHPDVVAEWFGFSSGDELLRTLVDIQGTAAQRIDEITRERMKAEDVELLGPEEVAVEAINAVHNEKRAQLHQLVLETLAAENLGALKTAVRGVARRMAPMPEVRAEAERMIARRNPKDISPIVFQRAEQKAAKLAMEALLKGDLATAFDEKLKEQLNHELYRAATDARETIDKVKDEVRDLFQKDDHLAQRRDMDLVNAARAVAASFGIGTSIEDPEFFLEAMRKYDEDTYEELKAMVDGASSRGKKFDESTYAEILAMREAVKSLWDLALRTRQIEIDGQRLDIETVRNELAGRLREIGSSSVAGRGVKAAVTDREKLKLGLLGVRASLRRVEAWVDAVDGGKPDGVFRRYVWNPISEATARYRAEKNPVLARYLDIVKGVESTLTHKPIHSPELDYTFQGKAELLGALLHTGNDSNFDKLTRGRGWSPEAFVAFIRRMQAEGLLVKADYDYAQSVWDLFESLKPAAQQAHRTMYGRYFDEITARPVPSPWGEHRGGYVPARVDPFMVTDAAARAEKESLEQGGNSFMFPSTGRGFTKARVDEYARPLWLDLRFIPAHIDAVLRFTHIQPRVKDAARIVMHREFRAALDAFDPAANSDLLTPWLQRTATQKVEAPMTGWGGRAAGNFFRTLRTRVGMNIMVANVVNTLQQLTGLAIAHVKVRPRYMRNALFTYVRSPKATVARIHEASEFMRTRQTTQVMEMQSTIDDLLLNPSKYDEARAFAQRHGYFMQSATQNVVDTITWTGAYEQAIEAGALEKDAVRQGDAAVRLTQGSFAAEDISRFETGTPFVRAFTMFYSYFNMQANLLGSEFETVARDTGLRKGAGRLFYVYMLGFAIPAMLGEAIVRMADGELDDDDDGYLDDLLGIMFGGQFRAATALFPFVGPATQATVNAFNDKWYDDRISTSPVISAIESAVRAPKSVYDAITDDGNRRRAVKDLLTLLGLLTGLPTASLARPLGYLADEDRESSGPLDTTRGLLTGRP